MVTLRPATQSCLIPPAMFCRCRKVPWCMSSGERQWKSCLNACSCHRNTKQAKWMLGVSVANVTLDSLCLQIQSVCIYFCLNMHSVDSNFVRDKIFQSETEFPVNRCISFAAFFFFFSHTIFSASHHLGLHEAKLFEWIVQRQGNFSAYCCNIAIQNYMLARLIDYLFSLNIDYQLFMLTALSCLLLKCLHASVILWWWQCRYKLTIWSHEFSCFDTDWSAW